MGLGKRLRGLDNSVFGPDGRPGPRVRTAKLIGIGLTAFGALLVLLDLVTDSGSGASGILFAGAVGGMWLGRVVEHRAQRRGQGLRDE